VGAFEGAVARLPDCRDQNRLRKIVVRFELNGLRLGQRTDACKVAGLDTDRLDQRAQYVLRFELSPVEPREDSPIPEFGALVEDNRFERIAGLNFVFGSSVAVIQRNGHVVRLRQMA
jgi:hypothetical protein